MHTKLFLALIWSTLLCQTISAQTSQADSLTEPVRLYRHEIAADGSPFIYSGRGIQLLYRHRLGKVNLTKKHPYQYALRGLVGHAREKYDYRFPERVSADTFFQRQLNGTTRQYDIALGLERQHALKRWRIYFGADVMTGWENRPMQIDHLAIVEGQQEILLRESESFYRSWWTGLSCFTGVQFFIMDEFSIGLEADYFGWVKQTRSNSLSDTEYRNTDLEMGVRAPRLFYLSMHFGK